MHALEAHMFILKSARAVVFWKVLQTILLPIIMEVENGPQKETKLIFQGLIFHFHDYGRKGKYTIFKWYLYI